VTVSGLAATVDDRHIPTATFDRLTVETETTATDVIDSKKPAGPPDRPDHQQAVPADDRFIHGSPR